MTRTGRVTPALWCLGFETAQVPRVRDPGPYRHIEIDKKRQVLFQVVGGRVVRVVHVSTGATGNTPVLLLARLQQCPRIPPELHVFHALFPRRVRHPRSSTGSVPAYPASHGCVRMPMWIAPTIFASNDYGAAVYIHQPPPPVGGELIGRDVIEELWSLAGPLAEVTRSGPRLRALSRAGPRRGTVRDTYRPP